MPSCSEGIGHCTNVSSIAISSRKAFSIMIFQLMYARVFRSVVETMEIFYCASTSLSIVWHIFKSGYLSKSMKLNVLDKFYAG